MVAAYKKLRQRDFMYDTEKNGVSDDLCFPAIFSHGNIGGANGACALLRVVLGLRACVVC